MNVQSLPDILVLFCFKAAIQRKKVLTKDRIGFVTATLEEDEAVEEKKTLRNAEQEIFSN